MGAIFSKMLGPKGPYWFTEGSSSLLLVQFETDHDFVEYAGETTRCNDRTSVTLIISVSEAATWDSMSDAIEHGYRVARMLLRVDHEGPVNKPAVPGQRLYNDGAKRSYYAVVNISRAEWEDIS